MNSSAILMDDPTHVSAFDKRRIANTFGRAAATYDAAASLQQRVAAHVRSYLPALELDIDNDSDSDSDMTILDMGCGTGRETQALQRHYPNASVMGLDLSDGMLAYARSKYSHDSGRWICGDIEHMPFADAEFDLVYSSLAIQWCESLSNVLNEVSRILKPGGWFVFSTLAKGSLLELNNAWQSVDNRSHVNGYDSLERQRSFIDESGLKTVSFLEKTETLYYPTVQTLLREMKALGANTVIRRKKSGILSRATLERLQDGYAAFITEDGLPASYQVIYGVLRKEKASRSTHILHHGSLAI